LRVSEVEESKAFIRMSRLVRATKKRSDLLNLVILLSLRLGKKTSKTEGSLVTKALARDLKKNSSVTYNSRDLINLGKNPGYQIISFL